MGLLPIIRIYKVIMFSHEILNNLYHYAYSLTCEEANAYDLLQDALARFLARKNHLKIKDKVPYVRRMIRNQFIDQLRREQRFPLEVLDTVDSIVIDDVCIDLERMVISEQTLQQVWELLLPMERELLYLWAVEGLTGQEIATQLNIPQGTILSRIYRLRKKIEPLKDEYKSL
ncbi:MAG: RNA polymerase sigma-70 factor (ECF subfamily) [Paraglaciecola sp.]